MTARVALVTGVGRKVGIGAAIVRRLAADGWNIGLTYWSAYDARMPWGSDPGDVLSIVDEAAAGGTRVVAVEADLADPATPVRLFDDVSARFGAAPRALVLCHCESVDSGLLDTTVESFDRHFAVNARATWLLVREFGLRFDGPFGAGRIVALTSDHTAGNVPYGASKGALDRIVLAAAHEFADRGIAANVVNPGATDTGWMTDDLKRRVEAATPLGRIGMPDDCARLVAWLCSEDGQWVNGQLLSSNGGAA